MILFFPSRTIAAAAGEWIIYWYGLLYLVAFLFALWLAPRLQRFAKFTIRQFDWFEIITWGAFGVLVGGRLGYVFFYEPLYFAAHPTEAFWLSQGGMSFHGGLIGTAVALWLGARIKKVSFLALTDILVVPVALGLALGRVGNFINQELYGTVTTLPWGVTVPEAAGSRHPVQVYAVLKDCLIAAVCFFSMRYQRPYVAGKTSALWLILYSVARFIIEFFREQEFPGIDLGGFVITRGQFLTLPVFCAGLLLLWYVSRQQKVPPPSAGRERTS